MTTLEFESLASWRRDADRALIEPPVFEPQQQYAASLDESTSNDLLPITLASGPSVNVGPLRPLWIGDELVLARRLSVDGSPLVQGCWIDWPKLREYLLQTVQDLLPAANLTRTRAEDAHNAGRLLATLPVELEPGSLQSGPDSHATASAVAGRCAVGHALAAMAVVGVVVAAVTLSERRIAFVSSVTHELRSPLTTFRLYCDLLADDMVPDPEQRRTYFETLRREAERLRHLTENVLFYARLERRGQRKTSEAMALRDLLSQVRERLDSRAEQSGMQLVWEDTAEPATAVRANVSAVEQILFNLVDNACKYAASAPLQRIVISSQEGSRRIEIRVRDHGPGISRQQRKRLFRSFAHGGMQARSIPGVGLGLALSRRLGARNGGRTQARHARPRDIYLRIAARAGDTCKARRVRARHSRRTLPDIRRSVTIESSACSIVENFFKRPPRER